MCLSTVYKMTAAEPVLFCKNIQSVDVSPTDGKLTFTDILGIRYEALATIQKVDLIENVIEICETAE
ncbi:MAG: CooT family nickel-binding protein [Eubacteriales bacterium]|nr:CooT family nickel-binding protein [Eubacteriales bacterium]